MKTADLVKFLRKSIAIQDEGTHDPAYLVMTDEEIELVLDVVLTRDYPHLISIDNITSEQIYPVILLAKKELFYSLAILHAPLYDIGADNNNYLKRSQRFDHYLKLIEQIDEEFEKFKNNGFGQNTLTSFNLLLDNPFYIARNNKLSVAPVVNIVTAEPESKSIELNWSVTSPHEIDSYYIYASTEPMYDEYVINSMRAYKPLISIQDVRQRKCRIINLIPNTLYYVVIGAKNSYGVFGYTQIVVTTEEETP